MPQKGERLSGEMRRCPTCGHEEWVAAWRAPSWRACSVPCSQAAKWSGWSWNRLQRRCVERVRQDGTTHAKFAAQTGIGYAMYHYWFRHRGSSLSQSEVERIAAALAMDSGQAIHEAGGETSEQKRVRVIAGNRAKSLPKAGTPEAKELAKRASAAAAARTDRSMSRAAVAKSVATRTANGGIARAVAAMAAVKRSTKERILQSWRSKAWPNSSPNEQEIQAWAKSIASRIGCPVNFARDVALLSRMAGPASKLGRKPDLELHDATARGLLAHGVGLYEHWPWGTGENVAASVCRTLGRDDATDSVLIARYWQKHHSRGPCSRCVAMTLASSATRH